MKCFIVVIAILSTFVAAKSFSEIGLEEDKEFLNFITTYGVNYRSIEELTVRFNNFKANLAKIKADNALNKGKTVFAVNHMSDWSQDEFNALLGSKAPPVVLNPLTGSSPSLGDVSEIKN